MKRKFTDVSWVIFADSVGQLVEQLTQYIRLLRSSLATGSAGSQRQTSLIWFLIRYLMDLIQFLERNRYRGIRWYGVSVWQIVEQLLEYVRMLRNSLADGSAGAQQQTSLIWFLVTFLTDLISFLRGNGYRALFPGHGRRR